MSKHRSGNQLTSSLTSFFLPKRMNTSFHLRNFGLPGLMMLQLMPLLATQTLAVDYRNVSLGSSLTPLGPNSSWLSPTGDFAFGFLQFQGAFLLGIWFAKIPNKTVVWSANKIPLQMGSRLEFISSGRLVLTDHFNIEVWTVNYTSKVSYAAMLDTGNFVLVSGDDMAGYVWQSFEHPTDTILPTQTLPLGSNLISHLSDYDYSDGRFMLSVQLDGNVVLYLLAMPATNMYGPSKPRDAYGDYWNSKTSSTGMMLVFDRLGYVYMAQKDGNNVNITSGSVSTKEFYQRATLDPDGVFRHYRHPRSSIPAENPGWGAIEWSLATQIPDNICRELASAMGTGACGMNAICSMVDPRPECTCPPRYSFIDPNKKYLGCTPDFAPQSCDVDLSARVSGYEIVQIEATNWIYSDFERLNNMDEAACRAECLQDCFCVVAILENGNVCWKKQFPMRNGLTQPGLADKALLKISRTNKSKFGDVHPSPQPSQTLQDKKGRAPVGERTLLLGTSAVVNLILVLCITLLFFYFRKKELRLRHPEFSIMEQHIRPFTFKELKEATEDFRETLGRGSFGTVYKGLFENPKTQVAVKKLDILDLNQEAEKEFTNEVMTIGLTHHKNLVRLIGFCNEGPHRLLVYEFMSKGTLNDLLFGSSTPNWSQRAQVAYGVARGLLYLHDDCNIQIIHCDVKPQNVLIDDYLTPKISDFGLAKLLKADQTRTTTGIRGTRGYVAPEWFKCMPITAKVDVYSFGVMLLEIICCRKNVELDYGEEAKAILTDWAYDCYRQGRLDVLVGHIDEVIIDMSSMEKYVMVALWCIQEDPSLRPSMKKVVQMLEGALPVYMPPDPSLPSSTN